MERGFGSVAHAGTYVLVSGSIAVLDPELHKRETSLLGRRNVTLQDFETVTPAMLAGSSPDAALASQSRELANVLRLFAGLRDPAADIATALIEA